MKLNTESALLDKNNNNSMTLLGFKTILHKKCRSGKNSEGPAENSWVLDLCPTKWKQISKSLKYIAKITCGYFPTSTRKFTWKSEIFRHKASHMVLSIIFLEDKHKILLHLSIFYEHQQFFQHRICFSIQPQLQLVNLHRNQRYFVIKLHTWFCLSYFLKTNIKFYCIYQYFMSINSFFNTLFLDTAARLQWPVTQISTFHQFFS